VSPLRDANGRPLPPRPEAVPRDPNAHTRAGLYATGAQAMALEADLGASLDTAHTVLHGLGIGALCGLLSVGGTNVVVPYLLRHQIDFKKAAGTATARQVPIGMAGALAYIVLGL
jgi:uncharacterized membrane protein YfcA